MKRRTVFIGGVAAVTLAALLAWAFAPRPVEVEVAEATVGPFETTIDEDARTRLADRFIVSAPLAGRLRRVTLREGDPVAAGDVVATLLPAFSPMLDERSLLEQQARVATAQAGVQLAGTRIGAARVALEQARSEQRRAEQLAQQGFLSASKIETDRLAAQAAQKELDAASDGERIARHELQQARAALSAVRDGASGRGAFALRSPVAGRVLKVHHQSETAVATGTPLLELGDTARMEVVAELLTTDALAARPGSRVMIERWGGPGTLEGRLRSVEPAAFTKVSALGVEEQRVRVVIDLTSPQPEWQALGDGYRVSVRIVTLSQDSALQVPVSAVFPLPSAASTDAGTGAPAPAGHAVFVVDGGRARQVPVQLGARNGAMAWIRSGLAPGTLVIVYPPATVRDGVKVAARKV